MDAHLFSVSSPLPHTTVLLRALLSLGLLAQWLCPASLYFPSPSCSSSRHLIFQPSLLLFHSWKWLTFPLSTLLFCPLTSRLSCLAVLAEGVPAHLTPSLRILFRHHSAFLSVHPHLFPESPNSNLASPSNKFYPVLIYQILCLCQTSLSVPNQTTAFQLTCSALTSASSWGEN